MRSDEELQEKTVVELKPHNAPITLVDYDPAWPSLFAREEQRIRSALGPRGAADRACGIHFGAWPVRQTGD